MTITSQPVFPGWRATRHLGPVVERFLQKVQAMISKTKAERFENLFTRTLDPRLPKIGGFGRPSIRDPWFAPGFGVKVDGRFPFGMLI